MFKNEQEDSGSGRLFDRASQAFRDLQERIVVELEADGERVMLPAENAAVIRFRDSVPSFLLHPHIFFMVLAILFALRAGLDAVWPTGRLRALARLATGTLFLGGMVFGPIVQYYAFGQLWTGVPLGYDLTDNKTLIAIVFWIAAFFIVGWGKKRATAVARWAVLIAAIVTVGIYMIPHSLHGSTLDYSRLEQGASPTEAIGQG